MLFDAQNLFSNKQALLATAISQNVVAAEKNLGDGEPVYLSIHFVEPSDATSVQVQLQHADAEGGPFDTIQSILIPGADTASGKLVNLGSVPPRTKKFLRLNYVVTGAATSGKVTAGLVLGKQTNGLE